MGGGFVVGKVVGGAGLPQTIPVNFPTQRTESKHAPTLCFISAGLFFHVKSWRAKKVWGGLRGLIGEVESSGGESGQAFKK